MLDIPGIKRPPGLRALPLSGFPEISFHALTLGSQMPMVELFINGAIRVIAGMSKG